MFKYFLKRIFFAFFIVLGIATLTFIITRLAPGDPSMMYLSPEINHEIAKQIRENYGLNESLHIQYLKWLGVIPPFEGIVQGNFGYSFLYHRPVKDVIMDVLPNTLFLTSTALIINFLLGFLLGIYSAYNVNKKSDKIISSISIALYSMPEFWVSLLLIILFSLLLGWFPSSQIHSTNYEDYSFFGKTFDYLKHLFLPILVLGVFSSATTIKYMRGGILDILQKDFILFARMKGLSEKEIFFRHVLRNSLNPIFTLIGLYFPFLLGSSVIVEYVFALPGIGRITIDSIFARDYPIIITTTIISAFLVIIGNLISDILIILNDPRQRKNFR